MKAQTEVVGLAFVVVIAIFALLLYVGLTSQFDTTDDLREKQLAASFLTALVQTDLDEGRYEDLVVKCITRGEINCRKLRGISENILNATLTDQEQPYYFNIYDANGDKAIETISYDCTANSLKPAAATQPIPIFGTPDSALISLAICK